jgi:predicted outer membrane repeat protein
MKKLIFGLALVFSAIPCQARIITVDDDGPTDFNNIQAAIDDANNGDVVEVQPGTYTGPGNRDIDFKGKAITIRSTDPNDPNVVAATIVDCNGRESNPHRGFYFHSSEGANSVLAGFTVINGYADVGGGIYCSSSSPIIRNCILVNNASSHNGHGSGGGGMYNSMGNPIVTCCTFSNNWARYSGGGMFNNSSGLRLTNCMFIRNSATNYGGGGMFILGDPVLTNCTFIWNRTDDKGGGISIGVSNLHPKLTSCLLWGNSDIHGTDESAQIDFGVPIINYCCIEGWTGALGGTDNISNDPCFVNPSTGDYHLLGNSPCINAGDRAFIPSPGETDIDGDPRVLNSRVDIGADECPAGTPIIELSSKDFKFYAYKDGHNPEDQTLFIYNSGIGTITWQATENCSWLRVDPCSGESTGEIDEVNLAVDILGLEPMTYNYNLMIIADEARNNPEIVKVTLYVYDADGVLEVPLEFPTIQLAINAAQDGDIVIIADNTYTGSGNRDIDFEGKAITVRSENGPINCIIDCNGTSSNNHRGFYFHNNEGRNSILDGLTIMNGYADGGGGIYCYYSSPTIRNCIIKNNRGLMGGGINLWFSNPTISNCTISNNWAYYEGGGIANFSHSSTVNNCLITNNTAQMGAGLFNEAGVLNINNCTVSSNKAEGGGGGLYCMECSLITTISNTIMWGDIAPTGSEIESWGSGLIGKITASYSVIQGGLAAVDGKVKSWGPGMIDADPCFADPNSGDYHLKSQAGRWDPNSQTWVQDDVTSPAIDTGNPNSDWKAELWPHGKRINMGAYGGTPEASMSLSMAGNVADLNTDETVNFSDFATFTDNWHSEQVLLPEDLNRNGVVDFNDLAIFADNWLWP